MVHRGCTLLSPDDFEVIVNIDNTSMFWIDPCNEPGNIAGRILKSTNIAICTPEHEEQ